MANDKGKKKQKAKITLPLTIKHPITKKDMLNLDALPAIIAKKVVALTGRLENAMVAFKTSGLQIGGILAELRDELEPQRLFVAYLNRIPGMKTATAYRYMGAFERASKVFPEVILTRILASNLDMVGHTDELPYGKYTDTIKLLPPPKNPTPVQADSWIETVLLKHGETRRKSRVTLSPVDLQRSAFRSTVQAWAKLKAPEQQVKWLEELFGYILSNMGLTTQLSIMPRQVPDAFASAIPSGEKKKAGRPKKKEGK